VSGADGNALLGGLFDRGPVRTGDDAWLQAMLDTEAALARAAERAGLATPGAGAAVTAVARAELFDLGELGRQATLTGNPVPALVRMLTSLLPADAEAAGEAGAAGVSGAEAAGEAGAAGVSGGAAGAVHCGATSQDIIDTAVMLMSGRALDAISADLRRSADRAADLAAGHAGTVMAGRTLLQQAVPVTFGLVAAGWLTGIDEARRELRRIRTTRLAVQFGGAAGTLASLGAAGPAVAALLAEELGLAVAVLPWHTDRLRIIELAAALTGASAVLGKIARDVTLLAQSEVAEVHEAGGDPRRGGSSAMPHKRNPVAAIVILGCTRRSPGLLATLAAAAEQEHQRAAGAWHCEWEPLSDLLRLTGSAASWAVDLLAGLRADPARMRANLDAAGGLPLAENVAAMLTPALGRLAAHDLVAEASGRAAAAGTGLRAALLGEPAAAARLAAAGIGEAQIDAALDPAGYLGATAEFIRRALTAHQDFEARWTD
jgi:3-carboxy-cis,cis-muconate cycloisomerase